MSQSVEFKKDNEVRYLVRSVISEDRINQLEREFESCVDWNVEVSCYGVVFIFKRGEK